MLTLIHWIGLDRYIMCDSLHMTSLLIYIFCNNYKFPYTNKTSSNFNNGSTNKDRCVSIYVSC